MKIKSIIQVKPRMVYAITTSSNTFIADGLAHHNCVGCNIFGHGKPLDFEERLKKELGSDFVEKMKASRHQTLKLDRHWYQERIDFYSKLLNRLDSRKN